MGLKSLLFVCIMVIFVTTSAWTTTRLLSTASQKFDTKLYNDSSSRSKVNVLDDTAANITSRRSLFIHATKAAAAATTTMVSSSTNAAATSNDDDLDSKRTFVQQFPSLFDPLYGRATNRKTILRQLSTNLWLLEQNLQLGPLQTPLRCTVIRLTSGKDNGKLWVHTPLAPTPEFIQLINQQIGGEVAHVVVPTYALEHKIYVKDFLLQFPKAQLWLAPGADFSYPWRSIGDDFLWGKPASGILGESDRLFDNTDNANNKSPPSWSSEIQYETLSIGTFALAGGPVSFSETVFYHLATKSLIVTDAVARIPQSYASSPTLTSLMDPENLLLIAKESTAEPNLPQDTPQQRQVGYEKTALLISYFFPEHEELVDPTKVIWTDGWHDNFQTYLSGRLLVPPVVRTLLYESNSVGVNDFAQHITTRWKDMVQIIPAHWEAPIPATATDLKQAFRFCEDPSLDAFPSADLARGLRPLAKLFSN